MRKIIFILVMALVASCGYSSRDNEVVGQVKKIVHETPIFCYDQTNADLSLGVIRNGVGSMSTQDIWVYVSNADHEKILKQANESGKIVKVKYDVARSRLCSPNYLVTDVELVN